MAQGFRVSVESGVNGLAPGNPGYAFGGGIEYILPLSKHTGLVLGAGFQRLNYTKTPVEGRIIPCFGFCLPNFSETEKYTFNSSDANLIFGLERQIGRWSARLIASPTYRLGARVSSKFITTSNLSGESNIRQQTDLRPGETVFGAGQGSFGIAYDQDFYLQLGLEANYFLSQRISIGLAYRRTVTNYEVEFYSEACGVAGCFTSRQTRIDARSASLLVAVRYTL